MGSTVCAIDERLQLVGSCARRAQSIHRGLQLCFGLAELVGQLGFALLKVRGGFVAFFFGLVQCAKLGPNDIDKIGLFSKS